MALKGLARFAGFELGLWAGLYGAYLATRNFAIGSADEAFSNASTLIDVERGLGAFHEVALQRALSSDLHLERFFDLYYMVGFAPLIVGVLVWLALRHRGEYRHLRTLLLLSIAIASIGYILLPTAPPRLVDGIGIADTVGLSGHDTGSVGGVKFNPYAAMPSMHVGWSLLVGLIGFRVARRRAVKALFLIHPFVMALTVTATGNHYFLDSVVGAAVALSAVAIIAADVPSRIRDRFPRPAPLRPSFGAACSSL
jgi:PAP2 superfamily